MFNKQRLISSVGQYFRNMVYHNIFDNRYIESKAFYMNRFGSVPCVNMLGDVDTKAVFEFINSRYKDEILDIFQSCYYDRDKKEQLFYRTFFVMKEKVLVEIGYEFVEILFPTPQRAFADAMIKDMVQFKAVPKAEDFELNIITNGSDGLQLKPLNIKVTSLDIDLYYNDDFKPVDELIHQRLDKNQDKGIILLHGLPGTGKTTYLRDLVGKLKKKVLFVSPSVASDIMNPEFIDLLVDHPNAVLIIEDAENIIMDRRQNSNSSVSNLLNLSDGLMSDCLNVQIICTFNNPLSLVDSALLRKGRLIARYEFGKLTESKAQRLSDHLGLNQVIRKPMTLAEISNPDEKDFTQSFKTQIGFNVAIEN